MADRNVVCYSFYVPEQDVQLREFLAAQSNLSLSMRLLAKAFIANGSASGEDVSVADLGVLVRAMRAENVADAAGPAKRGRKRTTDAGGVQLHRKQVPAEQPAAAGPEPSEEAAVPAAPAAGPHDGQPGSPDPAAMAAGQGGSDPMSMMGEGGSDPEAMAGEDGSDPMSMMGEGGSDPEAMAGGQDSRPVRADSQAPEGQVAPAVQDDPAPAPDAQEQDEADYVPSVEPDAGGHAREAYNGAMNAGIPVMDPDEDIAALMGDVG